MLQYYMRFEGVLCCRGKITKLIVLSYALITRLKCRPVEDLHCYVYKFTLREY